MYIKKTKKVTLYLVLFLFILFVSFCISFFLRSLFGDEIWNYGFSYNISQGMIPYRDFNVMQTPLYFFMGSLFIFITFIKRYFDINYNDFVI